jgi:hypothetical protein
VRTVLTFLLVFALAAPAYAAGPTATTAVPSNTAPQPAPGSPFSQPVQDLVGQPQDTQTTVTTTKRSGTDNGRGTLLFLSLAAIVMIFAVGGFIWWEGKQTRTKTVERKRHRMRSGRTPQPAGAGTGARRGPPPPPRKRRAQSAKRKKR